MRLNNQQPPLGSYYRPESLWSDCNNRGNTWVRSGGTKVVALLVVVAWSLFCYGVGLATGLGFSR